MSIGDFNKFNIIPKCREFHDAVAAHNFYFAEDLYAAIVADIASAKMIFPNEESISELDKLQLELGRQLQARSVEPLEITGCNIHPQALKEWRPVGIYNRCNDCPSNSIIQVIANLPVVARKILGYRNDPKRKEFAALVQTYFNAQLEGKPVSNINSQAARKEIFPESLFNQQCDAADGLRKVLTGINFGFNIVVELQSKNTKRENEQLEPEPMMLLYMHRDRSTMQQMVDQFFSPEQIEGGRTKTVKLGNSPDTLVVQVDRFNLENRDRVIRGTESFNIASGNTHWNEPDLHYEVSGCIIHTGEDNRGHYRALVKKPDGWYLANDTRVTKQTAAEAQALLEKGYLFFYEKTKPSRCCWETAGAVFQFILNLMKRD